MSRPRIRTILAAAVPVLLSATLHAGVNQWSSNGPDVFLVESLAADPSDPRTVYAQVIVSNERGERGLYKSSDGGETWERLAPQIPAMTGARCVLVDPTEPTTVYVGSLSGHFLESRDGGIQWEARAIAPYTLPSSIALDTTTGAIYLGIVVYNGAEPVIKSTDGGDTWTSTTLGSPHNVYALLADSLNQTVMAGTDFSYSGDYYIYWGGGNVARSSDQGATWSLPPADLGSQVRALAMSSQDTPIYYAGTDLGAVYRSFDGGANWHLAANVSSGVSALVVDPEDPAVLYAATGRGVFRSPDFGTTWRSFNAGMGPRGLTSLSIDSTGRVLHAGTGGSVFDIDIQAQAAAVPCAPGADHLCFFGSRFRVDLTAVVPSTGSPFAASVVQSDDRSGYFSFPSLTGDPTFPEVFVKMVDATSLPDGGYWVFYGSMTSVHYTLAITDTTTGLIRQYDGDGLCGGADVTGFLPGAAALQAPFPRTASANRLLALEPELSLLSGRFRVTLTARDPSWDTEAAGFAIPQGDRFGAFSLPAFTGDPELPEVFVKMLDAATGGAFLFFHSGLTTLPYAVTVVDTVTGTEKTSYNNPVDPARLCGGADVLIFPK
jgi:photosystem II stability/assembly factor-like uncharacterized protein